MPPQRKTAIPAPKSSPYPSNGHGVQSESVVNIINDGDIILVFGPQMEKYRVSSHMMRAASDTFNAMFGPNFSEGQNLNTTDPKEILLPDDYAADIEILCRIIHLQNDRVPTQLRPEQCLRIARLVDKYSLSRMVYLAADQWLTPPQTIPMHKALAQFLLAAELMDHDRGFDRVTKTLICYVAYEYPPILQKIYGEEPWMTCYLLERARSTRLAYALREINLFAEQKTSWKGCTCGYSQKVHETCADVWENVMHEQCNERRVTLAWLKDQVSRIPDVLDELNTDECGAEADHFATSVREWVLENCGFTGASDGGLCLYCTRQGMVTKHSITGNCPNRAVNVAESHSSSI